MAHREVHVQYDPREGAYVAYMFHREPGGLRHYRVAADGRVVPYDSLTSITGVSAPLAPLIVLPEELVDELCKLQRRVPLGEVAQDALTDARTVRDRLLTLVEKGWMPEPTVAHAKSSKES